MGFLKNNQNSPSAPMGYDMGGMMDDASVSQGGNIMSSIAGGRAPSPAPSRNRVSVLDIIGSILDSGAEFGGVQGGYQPTVDRLRAQQQQEQDRLRAQQQQEQDRNFQQQDRNWQEKFNQQKLTAGDMSITQNQEEMGNARSDRQLMRFGQASRGLEAVFAKHGAPGIQKAFPLLAKQLGMNAEETAIFGQSLEADPEGTMKMINDATTTPLSGYQKGQLGLDADKLTSSERNARIRAEASVEAARFRAAGAGNKPGRAGNMPGGAENMPGGAGNMPDAKAQAAAISRVQAAQAAKSVTTEMRDAFKRLRDSGGMNSSGQNTLGRAGAIAKENVPFLERMTSPEGFSAREDLERLRTIGITSLLPLLGSLTLGGKNFDAAKELEIWRKAIASATDYESAIRALDGIDKRIAEITAEQAAAPAASGGGSVQPRIRLKPRPNAAPASGRVLKYNPKTRNLE